MQQQKYMFGNSFRTGTQALQPMFQTHCPISSSPVFLWFCQVVGLPANKGLTEK